MEVEIVWDAPFVFWKAWKNGNKYAQFYPMEEFDDYSTEEAESLLRERAEKDLASID